MFQDLSNTLFWTIVMGEFLVAFGLVAYLAEGEKRRNKPE